MVTESNPTEVNKLLFKALGRLGELLTFYVVPIMKDDHQGYPSAIGTGLLIKHLGRPYIVSAGHVFNHINDGNLYFYSKPQMKRFLVGTGLRDPNVARVGALPLIADVGLIALTAPDAPLELNGRGCLPADRLLDAPNSEITNAAPDHRFFVTGFPSTKTVLKRKLQLINSAPFGILSQEVDAHTYRAVKLDPAIFLILRLEGKFLRPSGQRSQIPKLNGMSGSPIWLLRAEGQRDQDEDFSVTAITTEHWKEKGLIISVRVGSIHRLLRESTELHTSLDLSGHYFGH